MCGLKREGVERAEKISARAEPECFVNNSGSSRAEPKIIMENFGSSQAEPQKYQVGWKKAIRIF